MGHAMKREFSLYLDVVRFIAAALVVVHHSNFADLTAARVPFSEHGPAAVIIFFVLSGYVISYVASGKEGEPVEYWSSRLSRFYSLAIPVVLLCPILDAIGQSLAPHFYIGKSTNDHTILRIVTSLAFLNEIWTAGIMTFSNTPYWSLNYEMWYYVLFAVIAFLKGRARIVLATMVALLVGPKILLLAPLWWLGVLIHRWQALYRLPKPLCWLLFLSSFPLYAAYIHFDIAYRSSDLLRNWIGEYWTVQLSFSKFFLGNYLLGLAIAANFVGFRGIAEQFAAPLIMLEKPVRWLAGYTFSLYLMHQPLLQLYAALFRGDPQGHLFYWQVVIATIVTIGIAGNLTEQRRGELKRLINAFLTKLVTSNWWRRVSVAMLKSKKA